MNFNNPNTKNSTATIRVVCAIIFCLFTFVYLHFYQADILAMAQHVLSGGATHYDRLIGSVLITITLLLLQIGVFVVSRLDKKFHALTFFPSLLILAVITDVGRNIDIRFSFGAWCWVFPFLLLLWGGVAYVLRKCQLYEEVGSGGLFSRDMWINMSMMTVMFFLVGVVSNDNAVFHYRMRAEHCLLDGDYEGALNAGRKSLETDSSLTMIRMYALARQGRLGEELFTYPVVGSRNDILPDTLGARCMMYPNDSIYNYLGGKPSGRIGAMKYLKGMTRLGLASEAAKDYILCGHLIDRNLDAFAQALPEYYDVNDSLPKHYREALTLYTHLRSNPCVIYHNSVMDTDFEDLQNLEKQYHTRAEREVAVNKQYAGTYWWYYEYGKKH